MLARRRLASFCASRSCAPACSCSTTNTLASSNSARCSSCFSRRVSVAAMAETYAGTSVARAAQNQTKE
eukprot:7092240-Pyramimonas_sp.AAC.1